jgi:RNA polymerase sigma-70 factor (ECF subfamily)
LRSAAPEDLPNPPDYVPLAQLLEQAFVQHSGLVARIAYKLLRRHDEVSEVVQDVFAAAAQAGPRLNLTRSMAGWLATVAVRSAGKRLRRRRLGRALGLDTDLSYEDVPAPALDAESYITLHRVHAELNALPDDLRRAWLLRHVERESLDDVARLCGCSVSTAKRRINAAQARLRRVTCDSPELQ